MPGDDNRLMSTAPTSFDGATELTHWGLIHVQGRDAATFLHSQLSTDFKQLSEAQVRLAGYCNPKGRLLATFLGWRTAPDELWLACHRSVLASTVKRLSMFVMRADCRLSDVQSQGERESPRLWGLAGNTAHEALARAGDLPVWGHQRQPEGSLMRLPDAAGTQRALWVSALAPTAPSLSMDLWQWLDVQSAIPTIELKTAEQFVPQMINFELIGGIDFQKGCYPGQEVVARSQYRGTVKRRMVLFDVDAPAQAGQEVFHEGDPDQPAGLVVSAAPRPQGGGSSLLVGIKLAGLDGGALHLSHVDGTVLTRQAMPYPLSITDDDKA